MRGTEKYHIWTLAVEINEASPNDNVCPCTNAPNPVPIIPPFVGEDYFCETAIAISGIPSTMLYPDDPLWDGKNCGSRSTCCEFNNLPYFCQRLSGAAVVAAQYYRV